MPKFSFSRTTNLLPVGIPLLLIALLLIAKSQGYLLFHTLAEFFAIVVAILVSVVAWQTHSFTKNNFLMFLGGGYFWVGILDLFHALTFEGMNVFPLLERADVTIQFWIIARFSEALLLLFAPFFLSRALYKGRLFISFGVAVVALLYLVFSNNLPLMFIEGTGLTNIKIYSEYVIIGLIVMAIAYLWHRRALLDERVMKFMIASMILTICAEMAFTLYVELEGAANFLGHIFKLSSFWLVFIAIINTTLKEPFAVMARNSSSFDSVTVPTAIVESGGQIRQVNKAFCEMVGQPDSEILGKTCHELIHPRDLPPEDCELCKHIHDGRPLYHHEMQSIDKSWYQYSLTPFIGTNNLKGTVLVADDISLRKQAEEALRGSEQHYKRLVETSRAVPWSVDLASFLFTYVGPQSTEMTGYEPEEWYVENFWVDHMHPDDRDWAISFCETEVAQDRDHELEYRLRTKDGRTIWIRDVVNVIQGEHGPEKLQGFMFDVTERKHVEHALNTLAEIQVAEDIEDFYRACVKILAQVYNAKFAFIGLFADDTRTSIQTQMVWADKMVVDNFKYELEGTPCADIISLKMEVVGSDAAKKYPDDQLLVDMGVDSYYGSPLITASGEIIGLVSVMDVNPMEVTRWTKPILGLFSQRIATETERYQANKNLQTVNLELEQRVNERTVDLIAAKEAATEANRAKSEFLSRMSHELRTPLNVIMGYSHIAERMSDNEDVNKHIKEINLASSHLLDLIKDIMDLSRIETGDIQIELTRVNLKEVIETAEKFLYKEAKHDNIAMSLFDCREDVFVLADSLRLKEVILNLLSNAIKYNHKDGRVDIQCHYIEGDKVRVEVTDTGKGLDETQMANLFEPFSRLGAEFTDIEGTGVGLVIVKSLIERMNGSLTVSSTPKKGSCFAITLPLYK